MSILHVAPENDSFDHVLDYREACGCHPQVVDEGKDQRGFDCKTVIHQATLPTTDGKKLLIHKVWLDVEDGHILKVDDAVKQQQGYGSRRPPVANRPQIGQPSA